ncbi:hypothetical protein ACN9MI_07835 [Rhodococcoides fascians]|uniref:hypothetical protein n=1 Tax=Rhodococcoides fascians TaxID=1828 RepID=UPI00050CBB6A|nr:hypothetical protein [Rhodococcus fascians]WQH30009.1 hypothetical protein U2G91_08790 [Rhodococcus fascians]
MAIHGTAENEMAREMRELGYKYTRLASERYGVIIRAPRTIAKVRADHAAAESADLTKLFLARGMEKDIDLIFFARGGYTEAAFAYAAHTRTSLFTFDGDWVSKPVNHAAIEIYDRYAKRLAESQNRRLAVQDSPKRAERPGEQGLLNRRIVSILVLLSIVNLIGVAVFDIAAGFWLLFWVVALAYLRTTIESDD